VSGWQLIMRTEARTGRPLAVKGIQDQAQGVLWTRALRMPTPAKVAGAARRRPPGFYTRCGDGVDLRWLDPQGITGVVRANAKRALTADTRAQATAAEGMSIGGWAHEVDDDADRIFPGGAPHVNSPPVSILARFGDTTADCNRPDRLIVWREHGHVSAGYTSGERAGPSSAEPSVSLALR
jgi:hypothetical protein